MTEVDERLVAMHFDNKNFEKNAHKTIKTLEKLKESLDLEGAAKGFSELGTATDKLDFDKTAKSSDKFSKSLNSIKKVAKGVFSTSTFPLRSLGNSIRSLTNDVKRWLGLDLARTIEQAGMTFARSLTIDPLRTGWNEYEMKMDSIKTIMSGTAKEFENMSDEQHLGAVKARLEQLNRYADDTIYSFKDMTSNIGKFTNAGVSLEDATRSIMGISNLAAKAGQGAEAASRAMYNFSQSMSMGYVELRDWRSIENANMATLEFKQTLIDVGLAMGTLKKDSKGVIKTNVKGQKSIAVTAENVRETLKAKWLTDDVLTGSLEIYSGELKTVEEVLARGLIDTKGKTDEQIKAEAEAILAIGAKAKEAATEVRTFTKMYDALKEAAQSGWAESWEYIFGDMKEATQLWSNINKHLGDILSNSAKARNKALLDWRGMVKDEDGVLHKKANYDLDGDGLFDTWIDGREVLLSALQNTVNIIERLTAAVSDAWHEVFGVVDGSTLLDWTITFNDLVRRIGEWFGTFDNMGSRLSKIRRIFISFFTVIKAIGKTIKSVAGTVVKAVLPVIDPILDFMDLFGQAFANLIDTGNWDFFFDDIIYAFDQSWKSFRATLFQQLTKVASWFAGIWDRFMHLLFPDMQPGDDPFILILASVLVWIEDLKSKFNSMIDEAVKWFNDLADKNEIVGAIRDFFNAVDVFFNGEWIDLVKPSGETRKIRKKSQFSSIIDGIEIGFGSLAEKINSMISSFKTLVHWDSMITSIQEGWHKVYTFFAGEVVTTNELDPFSEFGTRKTTRLKSGFSQLIENIIGEIENNEAIKKFTGFFDTIVSTVSDFFTKVDKETGKTQFEKFIDETWGKITSWITEVRDRLAFIDDVERFFDGIWASVSTFFTKTDENTGKTPFEKFITDTWANVITWAQSIEENFDLVKQAKEFFDGLWIVVHNFFTQKGENGKTPFENFITDTWNSIVKWVNEVTSKLPDLTRVRAFFSTLWTTVSNFFSKLDLGGAKTKFDTFISETWTKIKNFVGEITEDVMADVNKVKEFFVGLWNAISSFFEKLDLGGAKTKLDTFIGETWGKITKFVNDVTSGGMEKVNQVKDFFVGLWNAISSFFEKLDLGGAKTKFDEFITNTWNSITTFADKVWGEGGEVVRNVKDFFSSFWTTISNFFTKTDEKSDTTKFEDFKDRVWGAIVSFAETVRKTKVVQFVKNFFSQLWTTISNFFTKSDTATGQTKFQQFIDGVWTSLKDFAEKVEANPIVKDIKNFLMNLWTAFKDFFTQVKPDTGNTAFVDFVKNTWESITKYWEQIKTTDIYGEIKTFLGDIWGIIRNFFTEVDGETGETPFSKFISGLSEDVTKFINDVEKVTSLDSLIQSLSGFWDRIVGFFTPKQAEVTGGTEESGFNAFQTPVGGFLVMANAALSDVQQAKPEIKKVFENLNSTLTETDTMVQSSQTLIGTITEKINDISATVASWDLGGKITKAFNDVVAAITKFVDDISKPVQDGEGKEISPAVKFLKDLIDSIKAFFDKIIATAKGWEGWNAITDFFKSLGEAIKEWGKSVGDWSKDKLDKISSALTEIKNALIAPIGELVKSLLEWAGKHPLMAISVFAIIAPFIKMITEIFLTARKTVQHNTWQLKFLEIAASVYLIIKSLTMIGDLADKGQLWSSLGIIVLVGGILIGFYAAFKAIEKAFTDSGDNNSKLSAGQQIAESLVKQIINWAGIFVVIGYAMPKLLENISKLKGVEFGSIMGFALGMTILVGGLMMVGALAAKLGSGSLLKGTLEAVASMTLVLTSFVLLGDLAHTERWNERLGWFGEAIGSFLGSLTGTKKATEMKKVTEGIKAAAAIAKDIDEDDVQKLSRLMRVFSTITQAIPHNDTTLLEVWLGQNKFEYFAENIRQLGLGLVSLDHALKGSTAYLGTDAENLELMARKDVDFDNLLSGANAIRALADAVSIFMNATTGMNAFDYQDFIDFLEALGGNEDTNFIKSGKINFSWFTMYFEKLGEAVQQGLDNAATTINVDAITDSIVYSINTNKGKIAKAVQDAYKEAGTFDLGNGGNNGENGGGLFGLGDISNLFGGINELKEVFAGKGGLNSTLNALTSTLQGNAEGIGKKLQESVNDFKFEEGSFDGFINTFMTEMMPSEADVRTEAEGLVKDISITINSYSGEMQYAGYNLDLGLARGITGLRNVPINAMAATCSAVIAAARNVFDQNSPSKVFEEIGMYNMQGLMIGTDKYGTQAVTAARVTGENYISEMKAAFAPLAAMEAAGIDPNPVITPVLDMSQVRSGISGMNGMIGGTYGMRVLPSFGRNVEVPEVRSANINAQGSFVQQMSDKLDQLNENITNLQVVLDSGVLVGQMGPAFDKWLGTQANRSRRG